MPKRQRMSERIHDNKDAGEFGLWSRPQVIGDS